MFFPIFLFAPVISAEKLTEDPNTSAPSMPSESVSESLAPKVFNIIWSELPCESDFLSPLPRGTLLIWLCVSCLQVKTEDVDPQSAAPVSVNLIDFTDLTPVVSLDKSSDIYQFLC